MIIINNRGQILELFKTPNNTFSVVQQIPYPVKHSIKNDNVILTLPDQEDVVFKEYTYDSIKIGEEYFKYILKRRTKCVFSEIGINDLVNFKKGIEINQVIPDSIL